MKDQTLNKYIQDESNRYIEDGDVEVKEEYVEEEHMEEALIDPARIHPILPYDCRRQYCIWVTHDVREVEELGDRVGILYKGVFKQAVGLERQPLHQKPTNVVDPKLSSLL